MKFETICNLIRDIADEEYNFCSSWATKRINEKALEFDLPNNAHKKQVEMALEYLVDNGELSSIGIDLYSRLIEEEKEEISKEELKQILLQFNITINIY